MKFQKTGGGDRGRSSQQAVLLEGLQDLLMPVQALRMESIPAGAVASERDGPIAASLHAEHAGHVLAIAIVIGQEFHVESHLPRLKLPGIPVSL